MTTLEFPSGFVWGAATSAYQIEGSPLADGAGVSIQHRFAHTPGNTHNGETGDTAADHYRRYREDVRLMSEIGLPAYQFSFAWPRIIPDGTGPINQPGLDFYDSLIDTLLENGISPMPILHVWDLPAALQDRGGWANRDSAEWFSAYAEVIFGRYGDRVDRWFTVCEPWSMAHMGYIAGELAPRMHDLFAGLRAVHQILLGHGQAVQAFRASGAKGEIGTSSLVVDVRPSSNDPDDISAADRVDSYWNRLFLDPVMLGSYPTDLVDLFQHAWPEIKPNDMETISAPIDFLGLTYYFGAVVKSGRSSGVRPLAGSDESVAASRDVMEQLLHVEFEPWRGPVTQPGWPIDPDGLRNALLAVHRRYNSPQIFISENGAAFDDALDADLQIHDHDRISYIRDHLEAAHGAIEDGVDLRGWFVWSFLDTWEFTSGLSNRFGLVHVDYDSQVRTVKQSGRWYAEVMAKNAIEIDV